MSIKRVLIPSPFGLEGITCAGRQDRGAIICHPHPLYGGDMYSNVVGAVEEGFQRKGFTTLRFNFRGVGGSGGTYDEGRGEVDDLLAAHSFLESLLGEGGRIVLAGYSFGAWICAKAAQRIPGADCLVLVSYPFAVYDTEELSRFTGRLFLAGGSRDDICPVDAMREFYRTFPGETYLKVIDTDHFYAGREKEIEDFIEDQEF